MKQVVDDLVAVRERAALLKHDVLEYLIRVAIEEANEIIKRERSVRADGASR
ncbi:hypothetical protein QTL95_28200 [Rhizobium sp. S152]|uniref:hypothetical protein n=1 Tax=Rhizobium sp. S152 TaxID=3055038 RepID=UPI0025A95E9E|nr:hypothetical protein [Rhizobium sp. S152]MDM9629770.1 hypothetical protein [Rhizobium sp. S152]